MAIYSIARGEVVAEPVSLTTDDGIATVLVVRDREAHILPAPSIAAGSDSLSPSPGASVEYEVSCRSAGLARRVLADLVVGDRVVVVGELRLDPVAWPVEDPSSMARVSLDAVVVGWDLGS